jgi:DNA-binding response OmpR family regulator
MGADLYARWHETTEGNIASVLAHVTRLSEQKISPISSSNVIVNKNLLIAPKQQSVFIGNSKLDLTAKEFDVLALLIAHPKRIFSAEQIFEQVWKTNATASDSRTVMVYVSTIRKKIEYNPSNPKYILNIRRVGYKFNHHLL